LYAQAGAHTISEEANEAAPNATRDMTASFDTVSKLQRT
jgi:hypothetical protein